MIWHILGFIGAFVAAVMAALADDYMRAVAWLTVCIWVHIATGYMRDARRYAFVRDHLSIGIDAETGEKIKVTPSAMDNSVDRQMAEFRK